MNASSGDVNSLCIVTLDVSNNVWFTFAMVMTSSLKLKTKLHERLPWKWE